MPPRSRALLFATAAPAGVAAAGTLCPASTCWVPLRYDNVPAASDEGQCVTVESYASTCTVTVAGYGPDGPVMHGCYFCVHAATGSGTGPSDGTNCSMDGTPLGRPPAGMVYSGMSGWFPDATQPGAAGKLDQLLCGGFHLCRCGDAACRAEVAETKCVDGVTTDAAAGPRRVCCSHNGGAAAAAPALAAALPAAALASGALWLA